MTENNTRGHNSSRGKKASRDDWTGTDMNVLKMDLRWNEFDEIVKTNKNSISPNFVIVGFKAAIDPKGVVR